MRRLTEQDVIELGPSRRLFAWNRSDFTVDEYTVVGRHPELPKESNRWVVTKGADTAVVVRFDLEDDHRPRIVWLIGKWDNDSVVDELDLQELQFRRDALDQQIKTLQP